MSLKNFFDFNLQTLKQFLTADLNIEEKKTSMRAKQLWQAVYKKGLSEFNHLTNLPIELRRIILKHFFRKTKNCKYAKIIRWNYQMANSIIRWK